MGREGEGRGSVDMYEWCWDPACAQESSLPLAVLGEELFVNFFPGSFPGSVGGKEGVSFFLLFGRWMEGV